MERRDYLDNELYCWKLLNQITEMRREEYPADEMVRLSIIKMCFCTYYSFHIAYYSMFLYWWHNILYTGPYIDVRSTIVWNFVQHGQQFSNVNGWLRSRFLTYVCIEKASVICVCKWTRFWSVYYLIYFSVDCEVGAKLLHCESKNGVGVCRKDVPPVRFLVLRA